jgi:hypothetical protein
MEVMMTAAKQAMDPRKNNKPALGPEGDSLDDLR